MLWALLVPTGNASWVSGSLSLEKAAAAETAWLVEPASCSLQALDRPQHPATSCFSSFHFFVSIAHSLITNPSKLGLGLAVLGKGSCCGNSLARAPSLLQPACMEKRVRLRVLAFTCA